MNNRKIKVCFVSPFAYSLFNPEVDLKFGGAEVQMYLVATELAKDENFNVNFVVLDVWQKKKEKHQGVEVYKAYKRGRNILNLIKAPLEQIITLAKINPDIVLLVLGKGEERGRIGETSPRIRIEKDFNLDKMVNKL